MRPVISLFVFLKGLAVISVIVYAFYTLSSTLYFSITVILCLYALFFGFNPTPKKELSYRDQKEMDRLQRGLAKAQSEYDALMVEQRKRDFQKAIAAQKDFEEREVRKRSKNNDDQNDIWSNR